ncbi:MAG TPA: carboxylating nicotinate-nucleotide diphosphorylase [Candidatus Saccharimonadales bacterium]|nr:carboxylating nicotinate-nucleotide diphosphorylase [Candidatus Saccharimonadales bacterium]
MRLESIAAPLVRIALTEDIGGGDATTEVVVDPKARVRAHIEGRGKGILAGNAVAALAFTELDPEAEIEWTLAEGGEVKPGVRIAEIRGRARAILSAERVALNFLQRLSGVATLTRAYVRAVEGTGVKILDTRKTTPSLRMLEKHAAAVGGALNHRFGLFDAMLIKENHARAAGGLARAVEKAKARPLGLPLMAEARTVEEAEIVATLGVDRILLDNFTPSQVAVAVKRLKALAKAGKLEGPRAAAVTKAAKGGGTAVAAPESAAGGGMPEIEISGGIKLDNVREFALPGVTYISVGALTHSAPALDLSLLVDDVF